MRCLPEVELRGGREHEVVPACGRIAAGAAEEVLRRLLVRSTRRALPLPSTRRLAREPHLLEVVAEVLPEAPFLAATTAFATCGDIAESGRFIFGGYGRPASLACGRRCAAAPVTGERREAVEDERQARKT